MIGLQQNLKILHVIAAALMRRKLHFMCTKFCGLSQTLWAFKSLMISLVPGDHFTKSVWSYNPSLAKIYIALCENTYKIRSKFCTCHDSSTVMACAKLWSDYFIRNIIWTIINLHKICIISSYNISKTCPQVSGDTHVFWWLSSAWEIHPYWQALVIYHFCLLYWFQYDKHGLNLIPVSSATGIHHRRGWNKNV